MEATLDQGEQRGIHQDHETIIRRWGRWRRLSDSEAMRAVEAWRAALGVRQQVALVRVHRRQVTDDRGRTGCSLVGVVYNQEAAWIYHTRALMAEDIVHELLHAAHPLWGEAAVVAETDRILRGTAPLRRAAGMSRNVPTGTGAGGQGLAA